MDPAILVRVCVGQRSLAHGEVRFLPFRPVADGALLQRVHGDWNGPVPVGTLIGPLGNSLLRVLWNGLVPGPGESGMDCPGCWVEALERAPGDGATIQAVTWKKGLSLACVTLSDKGCRGERVDASGPALVELAAQRLSSGYARRFLLPDEGTALRALLVELALGQGFDLILTTGGTGLSPRDVTPEATLSVIDKRLPGFERAMTAASLVKTPHAMLSRAVAGTLGRSIILNLPGSVRGATENFAAVLDAIPHALAKLQGDPADCGDSVPGKRD